jgi:hypothetical protein
MSNNENTNNNNNRIVIIIMIKYIDNIIIIIINISIDAIRKILGHHISLSLSPTINVSHKPPLTRTVTDIGLIVGGLN